jgi:hypothetical protein
MFQEDIDSIKSGCLALQCITALLLETTLHPLPGNPSVGTNFHTSRQKELPFLDSRYVLGVLVVILGC